MAEETPRRLQRFHRKKGETPSPDYTASTKPSSEISESLYGQLSEAEVKTRKKEDAVQIALEEVQRFKKTHKRLPQREEYEKMIENIYDQLRKNQEKEGRKKQKESAAKRVSPRKTRKRKSVADRRAARLARRGGRGRTKELEKEPAFEGKPEPPVPKIDVGDVQDLSVEDLFKETGKTPGKKTPAKPSLDDELELGDLAKDLGISETKGKKCPNCGKQANKILYCPECGAAFCVQCSKSVAVAKGKRVVCPKCGKLLDI